MALQTACSMTSKVMAFGLQHGENSCQRFATTLRFYTSLKLKKSRLFAMPRCDAGLTVPR